MSQVWFKGFNSIKVVGSCYYFYFVIDGTIFYNLVEVVSGTFDTETSSMLFSEPDSSSISSIFKFIVRQDWLKFSLFNELALLFDALITSIYAFYTDDGTAK